MTLDEQMLEDSALQAVQSAAPPISAKALCDAFRKALDEKWGYIWGTRGQTWTQANQSKATRAMTVRHGAKWIGRRVADCSGLFVWAYKLYNASIYHGSNTIFNKYCSGTGPLAGTVKIRIGTAVFQNTNGKRGHIGLYVGGGMCIEAKGTPHGVVSSPLTVWDEWGTLKDVDYAGTIEETFGIVPMDTLTKGSQGEVVKWYQRGLVELGYDIGKGKDGAPLVDGIFGTEMVSVTREFQYKNGLQSDGKAGKLTMAKLKELLDDDEPDEDKPVEAPDEPQEPADAWDALTDTQKLDDLNKRVKALEGRKSNG